METGRVMRTSSALDTEKMTEGNLRCTCKKPLTRHSPCESWTTEISLAFPSAVPRTTPSASPLT
jgi:hypothetical protein